MTQSKEDKQAQIDSLIHSSHLKKELKKNQTKKEKGHQRQTDKRELCALLLEQFVEEERIRLSQSDRSQTSRWERQSNDPERKNTQSRDCMEKKGMQGRKSEEE